MKQLNQTPTSKALAEWINSLQYGEIPEDVIQHAKLCCLDSIVCMVGGIKLQPSKVILNVFLNQGSAQAATIPGTSEKLSVLDAAYLNAQTANALDLDDCFRNGAPSHPGATVIPPLLPLAEVRKTGGEEFLTGVVTGYEISLRIGRAVDASGERKEEVMGYSPWQTFGASAGAASIMKLEVPQILSAFGLTGAQAPVPNIRKLIDGIRPYSWIKNAYGIAGKTGLLSALMAEGGFHGNQEILDGPHGFWVMSGSDQYNPEKALDGLGEEWLLPDVEFKPYACCRWAHTMLEALEKFKESLDVDTVQHIAVTGFHEFARSLDGPPPATVVDAQFNARYLAALELLDKSSKFGLSEKDLNDEKVLGLMEKISIHHDQTYDQEHIDKGRIPVRVALTANHETRYSEKINEPATSKARNGFSKEEMCSKFMSITGPILGEAKANDAMSMVLSLEKYCIGDLMALLSI